MSQSKDENTESGAGGGQDTSTKVSHLYEAWCSQHQMHPNDCFEIHYPWAHGKKKEEDDPDPESAA